MSRFRESAETGPSTSMVEYRTQISKEELIRRANARSLARYKQPVTFVDYEDFRKDCLVPELIRGPNQGLRPTYYGTAKHLRRLLQIKRLQSLGIRDRSQLQLQLYFRGYGIPFSQVRDELKIQYVKLVKKLLNPMRSSYLDNSREIGPEHQKSIERQMGELDSRFKNEGLGLSSGEYIDILRQAKSPVSNGLLSSFLYVAEETKDPSEAVSLALDPSESDLGLALKFMRLFRFYICYPLLGYDLANQTEFALMIFVMILHLLRHSDDRIKNEIRDTLQNENLLTMIHISIFRNFGKIFETLLRSSSDSSKTSTVASNIRKVSDLFSPEFQQKALDALKIFVAQTQEDLSESPTHEKPIISQID